MMGLMVILMPGLLGGLAVASPGRVAAAPRPRPSIVRARKVKRIVNSCGLKDFDVSESSLGFQENDRPGMTCAGIWRFFESVGIRAGRVSDGSRGPSLTRPARQESLGAETGSRHP